MGTTVRILRVAALVGLAASVHAQVCGEPLMNFNNIASSSMSYVPTTGGSAVTGTTAIGSSTAGAFPGGSVRYSNIGAGMDLLITTPTVPWNWGTSVEIQAGTTSFPTTSFQTLKVSFGYICMGAEVTTATCASGSNTLNPATAECTDGSTTIMKGVEYEFTFVSSGTTTQVSDFDNPYFMTFLDHDGDEEPTTPATFMFEMNSVLQATDVYTASTSTINTATFDTTSALYGVATGGDVPITWETPVSSGTLLTGTLPGVISYKVGLQGSPPKAPSKINVLMGGKSSVASSQGTGWCFAFFDTNLGATCPSPPPPVSPSPPTSPPPAPPAAPPVGCEACSAGQICVCPSSSRRLLFGMAPCVCTNPSNRRRSLAEEPLLESANKVNAKTDADEASNAKPVKHPKMRSFYFKLLREKRLRHAAKTQGA